MCQDVNETPTIIGSDWMDMAEKMFAKNPDLQFITVQPDNLLVHRSLYGIPLSGDLEADKKKLLKLFIPASCG